MTKSLFCRYPTPCVEREKEENGQSEEKTVLNRDQPDQPDKSDNQADFMPSDIYMPDAPEQACFKEFNVKEMPLMSKEEIVRRLREGSGEEIPVNEPVKLPDFLEDKLSLHNNKPNPNMRDVTKLVYRHMSEEDLELETQTRAYRNQYFESRGKLAFTEKVRYGEQVSVEWREKFNDLLWRYKDAFTETYEGIKSGLNTFQAHIGLKDNADLVPSRVRQGNQFSKALFQKMTEFHLRAKIFELSPSEPFSNSFIIEKPAVGLKKLKTVEDIEAVTEQQICKLYRMVVDLSHLSKQTNGFSSPLMTPKTLLTQIEPDDLIMTLDIYAFSHQLCVSKECRYLLTFLGPNDTTVYTHCRTPQGLVSSGGLACLVSNLIFRNLVFFLYVDDVLCRAKSLDSMYASLEMILQRAREFNICFKPSSIAIGLTAREGNLKVCGYEIGGGASCLKIPAMKKSDVIKAPRTRKAIITLINMLSYYNVMSPQFSEIITYVKAELERQKGSARFVMTNRLEQMVFALLNLIKINPGIRLISSHDYDKSHLICLVDATSSSIGGVLLCLLPNKWVIPISSFSKQMRRYNLNRCSNLSELVAADIGIRHFSCYLSHHPY